MPRQAAIRNANRMILEDREEGRSRSDRSASLRAFLEETEREEERQRSQEEQQRRYSRSQAKRNADIAGWIKDTSPPAMEDWAQQARLDAAKDSYPSDTGTMYRGSGRSFDTKPGIPGVSGTGAISGKKRAETSIYQNYHFRNQEYQKQQREPSKAHERSCHKIRCGRKTNGGVDRN